MKPIEIAVLGRNDASSMRTAPVNAILPPDFGIGDFRWHCRYWRAIRRFGDSPKSWSRGSWCQPTAIWRHFGRFTKIIHRLKAKELLFQYIKKIRNMSMKPALHSTEKPWSPNLLSTTSSIVPINNSKVWSSWFLDWFWTLSSQIASLLLFPLAP